MVDNLVQISFKDLSELRDMFRVEWPSHIRSFYVIDNYINWIKEDDTATVSKKVKIFALNGDWSDGSYVIIDYYQILFDTLDVNNNRLYKMLQIIPINPGDEIQCFEDHLRPIVDRLFESRNLKDTLKGGSTADYLILPKTSADKLQIIIPTGMVLKHLSDEHAVIVNNGWRYKTERSLAFIANIIKFNESYGLFNGDNRLIAWILKQNDGSIGILNVLEEYRLQGLGSVLVKAISQSIHNKGRDTWACSMEYNTASRNLLLKIGFEVYGKVHWRLI